MKKILVLGGNGFICNNLIKHLNNSGNEVYSFDLIVPEKKIEGVTYIGGDFFDDALLKNIVKDMDVIYHGICTLNPGNSNEKYMRGYERDFLQTVKLCDMVRNNDTKLIFLSSGGTVYGKQSVLPIHETALPEPINHYGNLKLTTENTLMVFGVQNNMDVVIARIANPYGPGQDYKKGVGFIDAAIRCALTNTTLTVWGDGNIIRDYIYIDDVCKSLCYVGLNPMKYRRINISNGVGYTQNEIISIVKQHIPSINVQYEHARKIDVEKVILDNKRLKKVYPFETVGIEMGISKYINYLRGTDI